jgi:CBS domain-containing protein
MNVEKLNKFLADVKEKIKKGVAPAPLSTRRLLQELEVSKRGSNVVAAIYELLDKHDLAVDQEIEWWWIDNPIVLSDRKGKAPGNESQFSYRIDGLPSANTKPDYVAPTDPLDVAVTLMVTKNYSQIPVMTTDREVKGVVSWKTISHRLAMGTPIKSVSDTMEKPVIVDDETSLFEVIEIVKESDYTLVRNSRDKVIKGIVTASDLSDQFRMLSEPFLLVGRCENLIRRLIHGVYTTEEIKNCCLTEEDKQKTNSIYDLTFGDYVALVGLEANWKKLRVVVDRKSFISLLDQVREIRNDIMHFDPDSSYEVQIATLKEANRLLEFSIESRKAD